MRNFGIFDPIYKTSHFYIWGYMGALSRAEHDQGYVKCAVEVLRLLHVNSRFDFAILSLWIQK